MPTPMLSKDANTSNAVSNTVSRIASLIEDRNQIDKQIAVLKAQLSKYHDDGLLDKKYKDETLGVSANLQARRTWKYSDAVENLKQEEIVNGVAEEKVTHSWTIRHLEPLHDA